MELLSITNTSLGWIARLRFDDQQLIYLAFHSVSYLFIFLYICFFNILKFILIYARTDLSFG